MSSKKISSKMIAQMSKQSLKSSRMRNIFVMITIVLASALLMAILMYAVGQREDNARQLSHAQEVGYYNLSDSQVEALKADERIAYQIQVKTGTPSEMDGFEIIPYYVSELSDKIQIGELESGTLPEKENEIAVQGAMLEKMGVAPGAGSEVTLNFYDGSTETFTVTGILKGGETAKQFAVFFSKDYADNGSQLKDSPYEVYAKLYGATTMHPEDCKEAMYLIGSDAGIERKYVSPSKAFLDSLSVDTQDVLTYGLIGIVILLACILVIYGVFYLSVIGKIHQFGQLRTIGMTKKQMKKLVSKEGRRLFLYASPIGILIGGIAGYFIIPSGFSIINTLLMAVCVFIVVYIITMISVHKPAKLAAAVSPMEALRYVPQDDMKKTANKKMCRSLTPLGLGVMNFSKNKKKAVITMLSLALGGILFMTAATFMSSFDRDNYARQGIWKDAEFHIQYSDSAIELNENGMSGMQAQTPMTEDMVKEIAAIDGVEKVEELKSFGVIFDFPQRDEYDNDDYIYPMNEEETRNIGKYIEEGSADYDKLMSGDYVLIADNTNALEIYGWQFNVGDVLTLHYYDGNKTAEKEVTVLGILNDQYVLENDNLDGWFVMPEQAVLSFVPYDNLNAHLLISADPEKETAVGEAINEIVAEHPELSLEAYADREIAYSQTANSVFGTISGLAIFIMMFSILSMMNTLITNIVTRKQELAMLESIGMSKGQIRKMLLGESLILVLAAVGVTMTIGTLLGYVLTHLLHNGGAFYITFQFPVAFAIAYAAVLIAVPLIITLVSMKSFSKEALVERLRGAEC
ncbi:MAG: ABC transporter permease [Anaerovoracaceae bacterium]